MSRAAFIERRSIFFWKAASNCEVEAESTKGRTPRGGNPVRSSMREGLEGWSGEGIGWVLTRMIPRNGS